MTTPSDAWETTLLTVWLLLVLWLGYRMWNDRPVLACGDGPCWAGGELHGTLCE
jgi:hypothetical protein